MNEHTARAVGVLVDAVISYSALSLDRVVDQDDYEAILREVLDGLDAIADLLTPSGRRPEVAHMHDDYSHGGTASSNPTDPPSTPKARRYRVTLFTCYARPQERDVYILAYDLNDAWIAAKRMESRSPNGNYTIARSVEPGNQPHDCAHRFEYDDGPVLDLGPDGVATGFCVHCGVKGTIGPFRSRGWMVGSD